VLNHDPLNLLRQFEIPFKDSTTEWVTVSCPYHADGDDLEKAHGGINKKSGAFKCFKCSAPGNVVGFLATKMNVPLDAIVAHADNVLGTTSKKFDPALVEACHQELLATDEQLSFLLGTHGVTLDSVSKYRLGFHNTMTRVSIPIYNKQKELCSIKWYKYKRVNGENKMVQPKGAKNQLYLWNEVSESPTIFITEGEFKAIILSQHGYPACAPTGGAGGFMQEWSSLFKDKHVVVVFDVDAPGKLGARKICLVLYPYVASIKVVHLTDCNHIPDGDITDYFVKLGKTKEDFDTLLAATPLFKPETYSSIVEEEYNDPIVMRLATTSKAEFKGKLVSTTAVVSAKDTAPFIVPKKAIVKCNRDKDYCVYCPVYSKEEQTTVEIPKDSSAILELVGRSEEQQKEVLKERAFIYPKCKAFNFQTVESYNVEEVRLVPQIAIGAGNEEQCTRKAYFVGHGINCNTTYGMQARVCTEPLDSHATLVIHEATLEQDDINNFSTTQNLREFQAAEDTVEAIEAKLADIYNDLVHNVTKIYQRNDLHLFYDLVWHTALMINFQGRDTKGWGDALVIGDSGQGKSECSSRLSQHYKSGERVDTKRASVAGIVGGLQETANRWFITWGTIPLNDRRLVLLEEIKGMGTAELSKMTDMRSSGIAEIVKIERAKTHARTRLIWISNPRSDSKLSAYNYGVDAVKELIGSLEDIRRFDMVTAVASGEVSIDVVNTRNTTVVEHKYTSDLCAALVGFAWSRLPADIHISEATEDAILTAAKEMGNMYSSSCPIVEPSDQRIKLARLSVALAIRMYSVDDNGKVQVLPCHVAVVKRFLDRIYSTKALGYLDYSMAQKNEDSITDTSEVEARIKDLPNARDTITGFIECELLRTEDICNFTEWDDDQANEFIGFLARKNCIKRSRKGGYRKTSAFIEILKRMSRIELTQETNREKLQKGSL